MLGTAADRLGLAVVAIDRVGEPGGELAGRGMPSPHARPRSSSHVEVEVAVLVEVEPAGRERDRVAVPIGLSGRDVLEASCRRCCGAAGSCPTPVRKRSIWRSASKSAAATPRLARSCGQARTPPRHPRNSPVAPDSEQERRAPLRDRRPPTPGRGRACRRRRRRRRRRPLRTGPEARPIDRERPRVKSVGFDPADRRRRV